MLFNPILKALKDIWVFIYPYYIFQQEVEKQKNITMANKNFNLFFKIFLPFLFSLCFLLNLKVSIKGELYGR